jgi:hypothetical protein
MLLKEHERRKIYNLQVKSLEKFFLSKINYLFKTTPSALLLREMNKQERHQMGNMMR